MSRLRMLALALAAALAGIALVAPPAHAADVTLSGVVRDPNGVPIPNMFVSLHYEVQGGVSVVSGLTGPDGSYSLSAPQGSQAALTVSQGAVRNSFNAGTGEFGLTGDRQLDFPFPALGALHASVVGSDGVTPVAGAAVNPVLTGVAGTSNGVTVFYGIVANGCTTGNDGTCDGVVFLGGAIDHVDVTSASQTTQTFAGFATPTATTAHTFVLAAGYPVSGVLTRSDGTPIVGATVSAQNGSSTLASTLTATDGSYQLSATPGQVRLVITGSQTVAGTVSAYEVDSAYFTLGSARTESLSVPDIVGFHVGVVDSIGGPVAGAQVELRGPDSVSGNTSSGTPFTSRLVRDSGTPVTCPQTDAQGSCDLIVLRGGTGNGLKVTAPDASSQYPPDAATGTVDLSQVVRLTGYATAASAGTVAGRFVVSTAPADITSLSASPVNLPDGLQSVLGRVGYRLELSGGATSATVRIYLPEGANPTSLFTLGSNGQLTDLNVPPDQGSRSIAFTVVDGGALDADGAVDGYVSGNVIPATRPPLTIDTSELPSAAKSKPYSTKLAAGGAFGASTWDLADGVLPPGLSLSADGVISGTATQLGTYRFTVRVRDALGTVTTRSLSVVVSTIAVVTTGVPDGYVGGTYSVALKYAGGSIPYWRLEEGSLPPGIKLSSSGTLSGTPTAQGTYKFRLTVASGSTMSPPSVELTITVHPMEIATTSLSAAPVGASYSTKLSANGGKGTLVWSLAGGALPPGLTLSSNGTLSGRPTTVGSYPFTVRVTDASTPQQVATQSLVIVVSPMAVATSSLPAAKKGQYFSAQLVASGGRPTLAWTLASGVLPPGLSMSSSGKITGYPKSVGSWTFTVRVTDASSPKNTATANLTLTVN